jgi:sodium-dependent dicarboxylate transporter 2/3/5
MVMILNRNIFVISISILLFIILFYVFKDVEWGIRVALSLIISFILLWIFEPIPFSQIAIILLLLLTLFEASSTEVLFSGFSSHAFFLIMGGLMLGKGVNNTDLGKRMAIWFLYKLAPKRGGLVLGVILIQQVLSIFIPAPVIRTALLIPIYQKIFKSLPANDILKKQVMMGIAYGGNISSIGFLPSAITNVITVEFINTFTGRHISYLDYFLIMFPLLMLIIPLTWSVILTTFPVKNYPTDKIKKVLTQEKNKLCALQKNEMKALAILTFTVCMWITQPLHHIHPAFSALMGSILLSLPVLGVISWKEIIKINFDILLIVGATFSIGHALNDSGTALYIASLLDHPVILKIFSNESVSILLLILFVQVYHLIISNTGTAIVTLLPIMMIFASMIGLDPIIVAILTNVTLVFGFILVVETLPNILAQNTEVVQQKDFFVAGSFLTLLSALVTFLIVITWWEWIIK